MSPGQLSVLLLEVVHLLGLGMEFPWPGFERSVNSLTKWSLTINKLDWLHHLGKSGSEPVTVWHRGSGPRGRPASRQRGSGCE